MSPPSLAAVSPSRLVTTQGHPIPLLGVAIVGRVFGAHARVVLRQRYRNDEARPIEAIYTFPVPSDAALVGFAMEAAGRRVEAMVKEREEAFRVYDGAVAAGHGAALLDQERANVFTASVGNLLPGEETVIEVAYVQALGADEGALRLTVPTLVAPRYIPGAPGGDRTGHGAANPTDRVPDADRISPAIDAVAYGLSIDVVFDLGREVTIESPSHTIQVEDAGGHARRVVLRRREVPLDRDLVLCALGAPGVAAGVVAERRPGHEGTFALTVVPDLFDPGRRLSARDVVFVIDVSGSMAGESIRQARSALRLCLRHLAEGDRFQIIAFNNEYSMLQQAPVPFTQATLEAADAWVEALVADGGTEMLEPLVASVARMDPRRDRIVVLLTDGQVGNEAEILERVCARAGRARFYTFGIGTNVSDALLRELSRRTRGAMELIHPGERLDEKVTAQFARGAAARVEGVAVRFVGVDAGELSPSSTGDLIDGEPWVVFGRYGEPGHGRVELTGTLRGERFHLEVPVELPAEASREGLTALWAAARIRDLEEAEPALQGRRAEANRQRIVALSVEHGVASKYASFVVVEKRTEGRRAQGVPEARPIPVHAPAGWTIAQPAREKTVLFSLASLRDVDEDACMVRPAAPAAYDAYDAVELGCLEEEADDACRVAAPHYPAAAPMYDAWVSDPLPVDPIVALFERQLASGLWEGGDRTDRGRLLATAGALEHCANKGIDSAHPVYGAQVKKAIDAVCALALRVASSAEGAEVGLALVAALKVASGRRQKAEVEQAIARFNAERSQPIGS